MIEITSRFRPLAGMAVLAGCVCLAGCAAPPTRTETNEMTTTRPLTLPATVVLVPAQQTVVTRRVTRDRNGDVIDEETDETAPAPVVAPLPVTRSTTETTTIGNN